MGSVDILLVSIAGSDAHFDLGACRAIAVA
ncbi:MAG: hypothetical protein RLZZ234_100, partial [Candidatus Parcubacteria bacterium]